MASQDLGTLNEQDCLNRMLLASTLRWAPLPPEHFPNGYVYFRRPHSALLGAAGEGGRRNGGSSGTGGSSSSSSSSSNSSIDGDLSASDGDDSGPVLVHCNWINGIPAKRYQMREALVWAGDGATSAPTLPEAAGGGGGGMRYLSYVVGVVGSGMGTCAFVTALALAAISNRTLVLPSFYVAPRCCGDGAQEEGGGVTPSRRRRYRHGSSLHSPRSAAARDTALTAAVPSPSCLNTRHCSAISASRSIVLAVELAGVLPAPLALLGAGA